MSTPTATMPAPKGNNSLEIVYTTLERQDEQGKALKEVVKVMIETKKEMIDLATGCNAKSFRASKRVLGR